MKLFLICFLIVAANSEALFAKQITVIEVIQDSLSFHPNLKAEKLEELRREEEIIEAKSSYYPKLSLQGLYAKGLPGSAGATNVQALVVSPYHKGPAAGVVWEQNIYDFGRTSDTIKVSTEKHSLRQEDTKVSKISIAKDAVQAYYSCAREKSLSRIFSELLSEARTVEKEVAAFVRSGQRSVVDTYLSQSQAEEIETASLDFRKRFEINEKRLLLLTGSKATEVSCSELDENLMHELSDELKLQELKTERSPLLLQAQAKLNVSLAEKDLAFDDHLPKLVGIASYGYIEDTWADIPFYNWSAAVGVTIPLFEGFRVSSRVSAARAQVQANESRVEALRLDLADNNLKYDGFIESAAIRIENIKNEVILTNKAFALAKKRYFAFQGTLLDLRESLRNLARAKTALKSSEFEWLENSAEKALLNGALENPVFGEKR